VLREWVGIKNADKRRWFVDEDMDLIVWYEQEEPSGFQICYDKQNQEKAFTWTEADGISHGVVDSGEDRPGGFKASPVVVAGGTVDRDSLLRLFTERSREINPDLAALVTKVIADYSEPAGDDPSKT
jgi:hypothetical protein